MRAIIRRGMRKERLVVIISNWAMTIQTIRSNKTMKASMLSPQPTRASKSSSKSARPTTTSSTSTWKTSTRAFKVWSRVIRPTPQKMSNLPSLAWHQLLKLQLKRKRSSYMRCCQRWAWLKRRVRSLDRSMVIRYREVLRRHLRFRFRKLGELMLRRRQNKVRIQPNKHRNSKHKKRRTKKISPRTRISKSTRSNSDHPQQKRSQKQY